MTLRARCLFSWSCLAAILALLPGCDQRPSADLILYGGPIYTARDDHAVVAAVAIRGERILAVGGAALLDRYRAKRVVDIDGRLALPGFNDAHTHLRGRPARWIDLSQARSISEIQDSLRRKARALGPGAWITGQGWSEDRLAEKRKPTRRDLDQAAPDNPVFLTREGGHSAVANSLALQRAGLDGETPDPEGGRLERFADGTLSGIIRERRDLVVRHIPPPPVEEIRADLVRRLQGQLRLGITSLTDASTSIEDYQNVWRPVYEEARNAPLPRATVQINSGFGANVTAREALARLAAFGLKTGDGDEWLKVGPLKVFVDGGFTGPAAWTRAPYKNDPDYHGSLSVALDQLKVLSQEAHDRGWQLGYHAIGDAAIEETVAIFDAVLRRAPRPDHRHYVNHFTVLPSEESMRTMARQGIGIVQQPNFTYSLEGRYRTYLADDKLAHNNAVATPLGFGIRMAFSSDVIPIGPLVGIYAAVTRRGESGALYGPEEKIDIRDALNMYTQGGAYMTFEDDKKGRIAPGMFADIIVLERNILDARPEDLLNVKVDMTILGGKIVYLRSEDQEAE